MPSEMDSKTVPDLLTDKERKALLSHEQWMQIKPRIKASPREFQVTVRIFDGWTMQRIARDLGISLHTVDTHWRNLKDDKLEEADRLDVIHRIWHLILEIRLAEERAKWEARLAEVRGQQKEGRNGDGGSPPPQASSQLRGEPQACPDQATSPTPQANGGPVPESRMLPPAS